MQLTATEFARLISQLRCEPRAGERRQNPRAPTRSRIDVVHVSMAGLAPTRQSVIVRDISRTGIGLLSHNAHAVGTRFLVLLPKTSTETFVLLCQVARSTRLPGGESHILGMQMVRRVTMEEYTCFLIGKPETVVALTTAA